MMTPEERILRARLAAHRRWANTSDPSAATAPARRAFNERFLREVDPAGVLPEVERQRRAESARKAYYASLALKSSSSRRRAASARLDADRLEAEAAGADDELAEVGDVGA